MATGVGILKSYEEGDRCVTEDGPGTIRRIEKGADGYVCHVRLDGGGESPYDLETLGEEIDVNRTCIAFGLCDGAVIGQRRSPRAGAFAEPICERHNRIADEEGWPGQLEPYRDPLRDPTA